MTISCSLPFKYVAQRFSLHRLSLSMKSNMRLTYLYCPMCAPLFKAFYVLLCKTLKSALHIVVMMVIKMLLVWSLLWLTHAGSTFELSKIAASLNCCIINTAYHVKMFFQRECLAKKRDICHRTLTRLTECLSDTECSMCFMNSWSLTTFSLCLFKAELLVPLQNIFTCILGLISCLHGVLCDWVCSSVLIYLTNNI